MVYVSAGGLSESWAVAALAAVLALGKIDESGYVVVCSAVAVGSKLASANLRSQIGCGFNHTG